MLLLIGSHPIWLTWSAQYLIQDEIPQPSDGIIVLAGDPSGNRLMKAAELAEKGLAPMIFVSGPMEHYGHNEADLAIEYAVKRGFRASMFEAVRHKAGSTREEAVNMIRHVKGKGIRRFIVVTSDFHTHRSARIYRRAAPDSEVRVVAAPTNGFLPTDWWLYRDSRKIWLGEWERLLAEWAGGL